MTPDRTDHLYTGYVQSKWVAEQLIAIARDRGLPISIYRPSFIMGHQKTGAGNTQDLLFRLIKGCIQLGVAPDIKLSFNIVPVDYVSQAIVYLSTKTESSGTTFHLVNSAQPAISWDQILQWLQALDYRIQTLAFPEWLSTLQTIGEQLSSNALYPLLPMFLEASKNPSAALLNLSQTIQFDCQNTRSGLADSPLYCPLIDINWLSKFLSFFSDRDLIMVDP